MPSFAPGNTNFETVRQLGQAFEMGSELGSLGYAHFGLKVANEDLVSGISLPKMISHQ